MTQLPRVVIVGRANVGKSTLFNRLSVNAKSVTYDMPGVTRDFIKDTVTWRDHHFELIDTGGISLKKSHDYIEEETRKRALALLQSANLILFMVDGTVGPLPQDFEIAKVCLKTGTPSVLVINKADSSATTEHRYEFVRMGIEPQIEISAIHGKGISDLLDAILEKIPAVPLAEEIEPQCKVVLLGKPNVGKSSLLNLLLQEERSIVADVPGTTREPIIGKVTFYKEDIQITDTPGVRRKSRVDEPLEEIMVKRAFTAMDKGNIVLLLIDASEGTISDQELKLAFYAFENYKAVILLFNKNDLVNDELEEQMKFETDVYKYFFDKLPQLHISCKTGKNIGKILPLVQQVWHAYSQRFDDDALTFLFKEALVRKPLYSKTIPLKVYRARQSSTAPIVLIVTVNEPKWFGSSQLAYFDKLLRKEYDLKGVPIRYVLKKG